MTKRALTGLTALLVVAIAGGCSSAATPSASAQSPTSTASAVSAQSAAGGKSAAAGRSATFNLDWTQSDFVQTSCPSAHATATACYGGTATGALPVIGQVTLQRTVYTTGPEDAKGCLVADTDGTLTASSGAMAFHATGTLCDLLATYTLTSSSGTGSLAGVTISGTIINNSGSETWSGTVAG